MNNKQDLDFLIVPHVREILLREVKKSDVCLELGCGVGQYKLITPGKYIGSDITAQNYRPDLPRRVDVVADAQMLPFKEDCFNVVFIVAALCTIPDTQTALSEVHRVLRDDGKFLIFDYNYFTTKRLAKLDEAHLHIWTPWKLKQQIKKKGISS